MRASLDTVRRSLSQRTLHLILLPTEACNFRCVYCYEDFALGRMKPGVVRGVKSLISARAPELSKLHLGWFGGEPLLARDVVIDVMEHARRVAREHPRFQLVSDMTTNGWLLDRPLFERLVGLGVTRYQISFDGPREAHDRKRVLAGGRGTFDRVWANVYAMRDVEGEFEVIVRIHVDHQNETEIPAFADQCREAFGGDRRFVLYFKALSRFGGPNDASLDILLGRERDEAIAALQQREERDDGARVAPDVPQPVCYASTGNSFIVRADGRLSKCTVALSHRANDVGRIHADGTLEIDSPRMARWMRGLWSGRKQVLLCPMIGLADPAQGVPEAAAASR